MKLNKSEIVKIITAIKMQCPEALPYKDETEYDILVDFWYEMFQDTPKEILWKATQNALKTEVYQKCNWAGAINREIENMRKAYEKTDGELWTELTSVLDKVSRLMYFGTARHWYNGVLIDPIDEVNKIYAKIDPILQKYVGGVSGLVALSQADTLEYEKGRFFKNCEILRKREKTKQEIGVIAGLISGTEAEMKLLNG